MEQSEAQVQRWWLSNKTVATVVALSGLLSLGVVACGGNSKPSPAESSVVQRTKNAALPTTVAPTTIAPTTAAPATVAPTTTVKAATTTTVKAGCAGKA